MPPRKLPSTLHDHLGYWLRTVSNAVSQSFARKVEDQGVTVAEWVLLRTLYDVDALAPSALADRMGMTRGAISKLSDRLVAKGFVERADNPDDARAHDLNLTADGRRLVPRLAAIADANDAEFFATLSPAERGRLVALLGRIAAANGLNRPPTD